jgi:hypothetical protein
LYLKIKNEKTNKIADGIRGDTILRAGCHGSEQEGARGGKGRKNQGFDGSPKLCF